MKDDKVYIVHILDCIARIKQYTFKGKEVFESSIIIQYAVIRNLEVIGKAAKKVSLEYRKQNPYLPWRQMAGL